MENTLTSTATTVEQMQSALVESNVQSVLLQSSSNVVLSTPIIDFSSVSFPVSDKHVITDLLIDQKNAADITQSYNMGANSANVQVVRNNSDVIGFVNMWNSYYPTIKQLMTSIDGQGNRSKLSSGFQNLVRECNERINNSNITIATLTAFEQSIYQILQKLTVDKTIIQSDMGGDTGILKTLETQIADLKATMTKDNETNARGALKQGLGVLIITVVVVIEIFASSGEGGEGGEGGGGEEGNEASEKVIEASIDMIKDDIKEQNEASAEWKKSFGEYQKLLVEQSKDTIMYASLFEVCQSMELIDSNAKSLISEENFLLSGWKNLAAQFADYQHTMVEGTAYDLSVLSGELELLNTSLQSLKATALRLESNGLVGVRS